MPLPPAEEEEAEPCQPGHDAHVQPRHAEQVQYAGGAVLLDGGGVEVIAPAGEKSFGNALLGGREAALLYATDQAALHLLGPGDEAAVVSGFGWQEAPMPRTGKCLPAYAFVQQVAAVVELVGVLFAVGQLWTGVQQQTVAIAQLQGGAVGREVEHHAAVGGVPCRAGADGLDTGFNLAGAGCLAGCIDEGGHEGGGLVALCAPAVGGQSLGGVGGVQGGSQPPETDEC